MRKFLGAELFGNVFLFHEEETKGKDKWPGREKTSALQGEKEKALI